MCSQFSGVLERLDKSGDVAHHLAKIIIKKLEKSSQQKKLSFVITIILPRLEVFHEKWRVLFF